MSNFSNFQDSIRSWLLTAFGRAVADDRTERQWRFMEEAIELAQAGGIPKSDILKLVEYTYSRPAGHVEQEVGGVMTTLTALCCAYGIDLEDATARELARVWERIDDIRRKQSTKPHNSPLPGRSEAEHG